MKDNHSWAKTHHYVPQFLLKNFAVADSEQIHVFDKREEKMFRAHVRKIAAENGLYDLRLPDGVVSAESALSSLEGPSSGVINKILSEQSIKVLTEDEKVVLALFTGTQMLRVTHQIDLVCQVTEMIRKKWGTVSGMPSNERESRKQAREALVHNLRIAVDLLPHFLNKAWLLFRAHENTAFCISDNPVTMHNIHRNPWRGSLGVAVEGIEIYLPLSPKLTLAIYCKSHEEGWLRTIAQRDIIRSLGLALPSEFRAQEALFAQLAEGVETGRPIQLTERITDFQNELQIWNSSRFIFSRKPDFALVKNAIRRNGSIKAGPRLAGG